MLKCCLVALSLSTLAAASIVTAGPAAADDAMMMSGKMDCSKATEMLSNAQKMGYNTSFAPGTGEIDRIILPSVLDREKGTNMMLKVEAQCGTDPKMKAMAAKAAADSDERIKMLENMPKE